jgi:SAM-dependent methyltransferase
MISKESASLTLEDPEVYDEEIRRFVPYYDEMVESILDCLPRLRSVDSILELGCRTGDLSLRLLASGLCRHLVAVDQSGEMVRVCRSRLKNYSRQAEVIQAEPCDFSRENSFDYVLANLSLHCAEFAEQKSKACRNVFKSLKPGGIFSFSVRLTTESRESREKILSLCERDVIENGVSREELDEWLALNKKKRPAVTPRHWLSCLKMVGFENCDFVWCETIFGTLRARKP